MVAKRWRRWAAFALLALAVPGAAEEDAVLERLAQAYYDFEVAGYCGLVTEAVGRGFRREVGRILGARVLDRETENRLRGRAWQAAHEEWQNRGLGGFRAWCRNEGRAAANRFATPP